MFAQKTALSLIGRIAAFASVAALMLGAIAPSQALAVSAAGKAAVSARGLTKIGATDFSARRRSYRGGAAAAAAFAGIVGTGLAIAAAQNRAAYGYYGGYYGGYGGYYGGGPVYYGGGPYYPYYHDSSQDPYPAARCAQGVTSGCW